MAEGTFAVIRIDASTYIRIDASTYIRIDASTCIRIDASTCIRIDASTYIRIDASTYIRMDASTCNKNICITKAFNLSHLPFLKLLKNQNVGFEIFKSFLLNYNYLDHELKSKENTRLKIRISAYSLIPFLGYVSLEN